MKQEYIIQDQSELETLLGLPLERVKQKVAAELDQTMIQFIRRSPLILLSSYDAAGMIDVSPKGDAPGFVQVDEAGSLLIPERPGNKLMFGFNNILRNPKVGLIFIIPNTRETLRVKGEALLSRDPSLLDTLGAHGKPALLCTHVAVKECFFHCGKAMIRSKLWQLDAWAEDEKLMVKHFAQKTNAGAEQIEAGLEHSYTDKLY